MLCVYYFLIKRKKPLGQPNTIEVLLYESSILRIYIASSLSAPVLGTGMIIILKNKLS